MSADLRILEKDVVIETTTRLMIPFIQIFGFYVLWGTEGAGGGFQGGLIIASSFILYVTVFGIVKGRRKMSESWNTFFKSLGLIFYAGAGISAIIFSLAMAEFLNYSAIPLAAIMGGPMTRGFVVGNVVEVGIGITVMAAFTSLFFDLAWKGEREEEGGEYK